MIKIQMPSKYAKLSVDKFRHAPSYGGVYFFYDRFGRLIYVGKTSSIRRRFSEHAYNSYFFAHIVSARIYEIESPLERELYETYAINEFLPYYNKAKVFINDDRAHYLEEYFEIEERLGEIYYEISEYRSELRRTYGEREEDLDAYGYDETNVTLLGEDLYAAEMIAELRREAQTLKNRMETVKTYIN